MREWEWEEEGEGEGEGKGNEIIKRVGGGEDEVVEFVVLGSL